MTAPETFPVETIANEPRATFTDKVLALAVEVGNIVGSLHAAGRTHGRLSAACVGRTADGVIVVSDGDGVMPDGRVATPDDDARAIVAMALALLPEHTPDITRAALQALGGEAEPARDLVRKLNAIRAAVPIPKGRHIRSIQRLAFPPPAIPPKRSKRHLIRIALACAVVGLGLWAAFGSASGSGQAGPQLSTQPSGARSDPTRKTGDGIFYVRLPPLPPKDATP